MDAGSGWFLDKEIGAGGFGLVRLFNNKVTQEKLVVKECRSFSLTQESLDRWQQELEILKQLDHPNIVHALDLPANLRLPYDSPAPLICLEYCEMGDLRGVLKDADSCCGVPEDRVRQICKDINNGIRFLHSKHIIHRDLKPENVLIKRMDHDRIVHKLTDFGYAKVYDQNSVCFSMVGTMQYAAPEVIKGTKYNSTVDFWSFGVVVFECITGRRPFIQGNSSPFGWIDSVLRKKPDDIWLPLSTDGATVDTTKLPQPNQLCSHFSGLITSWLQMALQHDPEMRKSKRVELTDIPCSEFMERILSTKIVNCVYMVTGAVCSIEVKDEMRVSSLQEAIQSATLVDVKEQHLVCSNGRHVVPSDKVTAYFEDHSSTVTFYLFTCSPDPSFKLIPHRTSSVNMLIHHQDRGIPSEKRKDVYAHVFFHLREQATFFDTLCQGHAAMLKLLEAKYAQLRDLIDSLIRMAQRTSAIAEFVQEMHCQDCKQLEDLRIKVPELKPCIGRTLQSWMANETELKRMTESVEKQLKGISKHQEVFHKMVNKGAALKHNHDEVCDQIKWFRKNYVLEAKELCISLKRNNGGVADANRMCDLFLNATIGAQQIVENKLNGHNYCVLLREVISNCDAMETQLQELKSTEKAIKKMNEGRQDNTWKLLSHERKVTPFTSSPISSPVTSIENNVTHSLPPRFLSQLSQASNDSKDHDPAKRSVSKTSSSELSQSSIEQSILLEILEKDPVDSDTEIEKNKVLLKRLNSLIGVHSPRNSKASLNESS